MAASSIRVPVALGERSYDVWVANNDCNGMAALARGHAALLVTDRNVEPCADPIENALRGAGLHVVRKTLPSGETQKSLSSAETLYDWLAEQRTDRKALVVALGGGVIGDLVGFVAATYNRGLDLMMAPTSLLAMVDSSVGGKVGVNHPQGKNLIGAFHQPVAVWIDVALLETLPEREYRSGLAEVVKYGVILDADFFDYLERHVDAVLKRDAATITHVVAQCCRLKAQVVTQDERELLGLRVVLNYGHTFAHAFETVAGYGAWLHGEAVAAGMICASRLAERHGLIPDEVTQRQRRLLEALNLPTALPVEWPIDDLIRVMQRDKKNVDGRMRFVLPRTLGTVDLFDDVKESDVRAVLGGMTRT